MLPQRMEWTINVSRETLWDMVGNPAERQLNL